VKPGFRTEQQYPGTGEQQEAGAKNATTRQASLLPKTDETTQMPPPLLPLSPVPTTDETNQTPPPLPPMSPLPTTNETTKMPQSPPSAQTNTKNFVMAATQTLSSSPLSHFANFQEGTVTNRKNTKT
jgi:hypothetical protein